VTLAYRNTETGERAFRVPAIRRTDRRGLQAGELAIHRSLENALEDFVRNSSIVNPNPETYIYEWVLEYTQ